MKDEAINSRSVVSGGCQCGAVRYQTTKILNNAHLCHCRMCQKAVGNVFSALVSVPKAAFRWTRGTPSSWRSSEHVDRGFCKCCGTPLFYDDISCDTIAVTIGSLDHPEHFVPVSHDGIEGRMPWFERIPDFPDRGPTDQPAQEEWAAAIKASNRQHPDHDRIDWP